MFFCLLRLANKESCNSKAGQSVEGDANSIIIVTQSLNLALIWLHSANINGVGVIIYYAIVVMYCAQSTTERPPPPLLLYTLIWIILTLTGNYQLFASTCPSLCMNVCNGDRDRVLAGLVWLRYLRTWYGILLRNGIKVTWQNGLLWSHPTLVHAV